MCKSIALKTSSVMTLFFLATFLNASSQVEKGLEKQQDSSLRVESTGHDSVSAQPPDTVASADQFYTYQGLKDEFLIDIPAGWSAYDQGKMVGNKLGSPFNLVIFSPVNIAEMEIKDQLKAVGMAGTGELPSFIMNRLEPIKKTYCSSLIKKGKKKILKMIKKGAKSIKGAKIIEKFKVDSVSIGSCQGLRVRGKIKHSNGNIEIYDILAITDSKVLYFFLLRQQEKYYEENLPVYEKAISSIRLKNLQ